MNSHTDNFFQFDEKFKRKSTGIFFHIQIVFKSRKSLFANRDVFRSVVNIIYEHC